MKLHEYQTKEIFRRYDISVPRGKIADTSRKAVSIFKELKAESIVIKAQIYAGARGKAGGIKEAHSAKEVKKIADDILGMRLISPQTGPEGKTVRTVLVEKAVKNIDGQLYIAITIDRSLSSPVMLVSRHGGVDIEETAKAHPEAIIRESINPLLGLLPFQLRRIIKEIIQGGRFKVQGPAFHRIATGLAKLFLELDASLVEINPLAIKDGDLIAIDGKLNIDDNALFRHPDLVRLKDITQQDPDEKKASGYGLSYVGLTGNIGCMVNGAGLAMATMDLIKSCGGEPANFLDVGGGADEDKVKDAFKLILSDKKVKVILVNIFGGIMKCDVLAQGILEAARKIKVNRPMVVRLEGTNVEDGRRLFSKSDLNIVFAKDMQDAARKAVGLAR